MRVTETLNEGLKRKLDVSIPATDLAVKLDEKLNELKGSVQIKGFRPGKVPFAHLKKVYGRSAMSEVMREAMNSGVAKTLQERSERPALQPVIDLTEDQSELDKMFDLKADLDFTVSYEILPKVKLMDLSTIEIERPIVEVADEEVDREYARFVDGNRPFAVKDGKAEKGDRVTMNFIGRIDGELFQGGEAEGAMVVLGSGQFLPGFEDQLVGAKKDDTLKVNATFPDDYSAADLAGKKAIFDVLVTGLEAPTDIAIDDEFAKQFGVNSISELKNKIKEQISNQYMTLTRRRVRRLVLDALDKGHEFDVPQNLYDEEFKTIWERVKHEVEHHGRSFEAEGTTEEQAKEDYRRIANRRVRLGLVVAEIGTENQVKVEDAELQQALIAEVQRFPGQEQQVYDYYRKTPQALNALRAPLFEGKVIEFVISKSKVTDKVVTRDELSDLVAQDQELNAKENPPDHSGHEHAHDHDHDHGDDHDHPH